MIDIKVASSIGTTHTRLRKYCRDNKIHYKTNRYTFDECLFDADTESSYYWVGILAADGYVYNNKGKN